jgi:methyl-accepting chemotaxis protein/ABC-type polysaccharide/polyol phosphate export permease
MKKIISRTIYEVYKNFKLIFRNWSALLLIILAPLILIVLVGYSFSSDDLHDIKVGAIINGDIDLTELESNVAEFGEIIEYKNVKDCILEMTFEENHICLEFRGEFAAKKGEIPTGEIIFYYDNTRQKLSLLLMNELKEYFGLTAEKISLISTQEIFSNLQNLLGFVNARINDIDNVKEESKTIKQDLIERKQDLIEVRDDFTPRYKLVKSAQSNINNYIRSFNQVSGTLAASLNDLKDATDDLKVQLGALPDSANLSLQAQLVNLAISKLETEINDVADLTDATNSEVNKIGSSLDSVVDELDSINELLNDEIERSDKYIGLIDESIVEMERISREAKEKIGDLSSLDPSLAQKIVKPITQTFKALIINIRDIQLTFPLLLATVIVFISLLFSNIITLLEIHNKAYVRNILAPVDDLVYTMGLAITSFFIIFFQIIILLFVAQTQFSVNVLGRLPDLLPPIIVMVFIFIFIGMILAYISKDIQSSILLATFVALGFFLFSNILNALEAMPKLAAYAAVLNPIVLVIGIFRKVLFFNIPLTQIHSFGLLVIYMITAGYFLMRFSKKKNMQRL